MIFLIPKKSVSLPRIQKKKSEAKINETMCDPVFEKFDKRVKVLTEVCYV